MFVAWRNKCSLKQAGAQKAASNNSPIREPMVRINFCTKAQTTKGTPPQQAQKSLNEIFQHLENQLPNYIRLVPAITIWKWIRLRLKMLKHFCESSNRKLKILKFLKLLKELKFFYALFHHQQWKTDQNLLNLGLMLLTFKGGLTRNDLDDTICMIRLIWTCKLWNRNNFLH